MEDKEQTPYTVHSYLARIHDVPALSSYWSGVDILAALWGSDLASFLDSGPDVNLANAYGVTALHAAACLGDGEMA